MVDARLPTLREDLSLMPGGHDEEGAPRWLLYDVISHRYFSLFERSLTLIRHWQPGLSIDEMVEALKQHGHEFDADEVRAFSHFLIVNHLVLARTPGAADYFHKQHQARQKGFATWLLHNYLFIKIPLVRPQPWLERAVPKAEWLFHPWLSRLIIALGVIGGFMVLRQWEAFIATFVYFFSLEGMLLYALTLVLVKSAHELGHAVVSCRLGCRVTSMGIAFLVLMPMLFTDTTDAWKLDSKKDRLKIVTAGVRTELYIALLATFLWSVLPDGTWRSAAFFLATTSWVTSVLINISPFLRFDGYYAFSDLLGVENLQQRGFALARWKLREWLWGLKDPMPEPMPRPRARLLVLYGLGTWVYRFVLFLGIALLVYHLFFKVLGMFLFAVEILWFIVMPIYREMRVWWRRKSHFEWSRRRLMVWSIPVGLLVLGVIPLPAEVKVPAVMRTVELQALFAPESAQIIDLEVVDGQSVDSGEVLLRLHAPTLDHEMDQTRLKIRQVNEQLSRQTSSMEQRALLAVNQQRLVQLERRLDGLETRQQRLTLKAPFKGRVELLAPLHEGQWVSESRALFSLQGVNRVKVDGLLNEQDLSLMATGQTGIFITDSGEQESLAVTLADIDVSAISSLRYPELGSEHGGDIAVRKLEDGRLVPVSAHYRVEALLEEKAPSWALRRQYSGTLVINAEARSWFYTQYQRIVSIFVREAGF